MAMESQFLSRYDRLFGLKDLEVVDVRATQGGRPGQQLLEVSVIARQSVFLCPRCSKACGFVHSHSEREIMDLAQGAIATRLKVQIPRMHCQSCDTHFTPVFGELHPSSAVTQRFADELLKLVRISSVKEAASHLGIAESTAESIYYYEAKRLVDKSKGTETEPIRSLGIDEIAVKKGSKITPAS